MPRLAFVAFTLILLSCEHTAPAQQRVVVQELQGRDPFIQSTPDGKLAWLPAGVNNHILQVLDPAAAVILRHFHLPDRIQSSWIDSDSGTLVVSTNSAIHVGRLHDDHLDEILPGIHGAVMLDPGARLLAVLGRIPTDKDKDRPGTLRDERTLGVFDLAKRAWRHKQHTPIVSPYPAAVRHEGPVALLFHEDALLAGGVGGNLGSMIPITYPVDVRLDLKTGKTKITTGTRSRDGKVVDELPGAKPGVVPKGYEGVDFQHDPKHAYPAALIEGRDKLAAVARKVWEDKALARLRLAEPARHGAPMPFVAEVDRVQLAVRRYLRIVGAFGSHTAILSLTRDGKLTLGPTRNTSDNPFGRGVMSVHRVQSSDIDLTDLITGKPMLPADVIKAEGDKDAYFVEGEGTLLQTADRLSFYRPGKEKPEWTRKSMRRRWVDAQLDDSRKVLAMSCGDEPILAEIIRLEDGETLGTIPRPEDITDNYMSMALSRDGKRLGVMKRQELRVFDARSGKQLESHAVLEDTYSRSLHSWSGGWLVSSESRAQLFNDRTKKFDTIVPFRSVVQLEEVDTPKGKRFLLQNYYGECGVIDPAEGKVLSRWIAAEYGTVGARWSAVFAQGKALVRHTGGPAVEVMDLRDNQVMLTVHNVPMGKDLGYIAFTPDGWWDASPGAEVHVAVFEKGVRVAEEGRDRRRNAKLIQERLAELWR